MTQANQRDPERRTMLDTNDARWSAVRTRDAGADGTFWYSVATTGVYCRPSCASRPAKRENVAFHATTADAESAGFRPCKRCKPDQPSDVERNAKRIADLCRFIDGRTDVPTLDELAGRAGLSVFHTHRLFKAVTGVTPRAYASSRRADRVREELRTSATVTDAIYGAGYGSSARFYEKADELLGMKPSTFRAGGEGLEIRFAIRACSLGSVLVAATSRGVCAVLLGNDHDALASDLERRFPRAAFVGANADFEALVADVVALVEEPHLGIKLPLDIRGTVFQERVWKALAAIPAGKTRTYSDVATAIGAPSAVRAVAQACAANPIAVAIPCHRVVRADGDLAGYRWGVERKRALLAREAAELAPLAPKARR